MAEQFGSTPGRVVPAGAKVSPGGEQGPPGPPGPAGEVTTSEGIWNYHKTDTDTDTSPVSGRFKTDSGNYRDATQIAIHAVTIQGVDRTNTLRTLLVGDIIQCQDTVNGAAWCRYTLLAPPVDHGSWFQLNVALEADGGVASGDNQEIAFTFTAGGAGGVSDGFVSYDAAQALTAPQQTQARTNIYAAPLDAMAYSGMQINGGMEISQERGTTPTASNAFVVDGWLLASAGTMVLSAAQFNGLGFPVASALAVGVVTAQPTMGTNDYAALIQNIEGYRVSRLRWGTASAQPITIGFWVAHTRTGLYAGAIRNSANTRSYVFTYTQNVANALEYKTVTIPGDTAGTWSATNTIGMAFIFTIASGTVFSTATPNAWLAGSFINASGAVNGVAATSDNFRITGVTILPGIQVPTAAQSPLIMRPYGEELATCQRYYSTFPWYARFTASAGGQALTMPVVLPAEMRTTPTCSIVTVGARNNVASVTFSSIDERVARYEIVSTAAGDTYALADVVSVDARL